MEIHEVSHKAAERKFDATAKGEEPLHHLLIRFAIYNTAFSAVILLLPVIVRDGGFGTFREEGPIEWLQLPLLITCTVLFMVESVQNLKRRHLLILLASFTIFASIRELDSVLDRANPLGGHTTPELLLLLATVIYTYWNRTDIWRAFGQMMSGRAFTIIWCGFLVAVPFAQPFGYQGFLRLLLKGDYSRFIKNMIEESGELVGYLLILIGTIEFVWECRRERKFSSREKETR